jgi:hypothetical protein
VRATWLSGGFSAVFGHYNTASGGASSVSGGFLNTASAALMSGLRAAMPCYGVEVDCSVKPKSRLRAASAAKTRSWRLHRRMGRLTGKPKETPPWRTHLRERSRSHEHHRREHEDGDRGELPRGLQEVATGICQTNTSGDTTTPRLALDVPATSSSRCQRSLSAC